MKHVTRLMEEKSKRVEELEGELTALRQDPAADQAEIRATERRHQLAREDLRDLVASIEQAKVDAALDPANKPSLSLIERPTPAKRIESE